MDFLKKQQDLVTSGVQGKKAAAEQTAKGSKCDRHMAVLSDFFQQ